MHFIIGGNHILQVNEVLDRKELTLQFDLKYSQKRGAGL